MALVDYGHPPRSREDRVKVVEKIYSHARSAPSGDRSVEAAARLTHEVTQEAGDDYLVFLFSDANLGRYGISPTAFSAAMRGDGRSQGYCIFIAEPGAAEWMVDELPFGRGFVVLDVDKLPQTFSEILTHATTMS